MLFLTYKTKYISSAAGGGARGRDAGTARGIMTAAGWLTASPRLSIKQFLRAGEMIIETAAGEDTPGNMKKYLMTGCIKTGGPGTTIDIGKEKGHGMCRACRGNNTAILNHNPDPPSVRVITEDPASRAKKAAKNRNREQFTKKVAALSFRGAATLPNSRRNQ